MKSNWWKRTHQGDKARSPSRESGERPLLRVRFTSTPDLLISRRLIGLRMACWNSELCNLAMFAYDIEGLGAFVFPERGSLMNELECWFVELNACFKSINPVVDSRIDDSRFLGCSITDLLVPASRDARVPDSQVLMLSSGFGLAQESGTPHGILPSLTLVASESPGAGLVSIWNDKK